MRKCKKTFFESKNDGGIARHRSVVAGIVAVPEQTILDLLQHRGPLEPRLIVTCLVNIECGSYHKCIVVSKCTNCRRTALKKTVIHVIAQHNQPTSVKKFEGCRASIDWPSNCSFTRSKQSSEFDVMLHGHYQLRHSKANGSHNFSNNRTIDIEPTSSAPTFSLTPLCSPEVHRTYVALIMIVIIIIITGNIIIINLCYR